MSSSDEALDDLVFQVLERRDSGDQRALDECCRTHPELADALRRRVAALAESGLLGGGRDGGDVPAVLGEFRLGRKLGQGGMGVVFVAEQPALGRRVAIKLVRPEQLYFADARQRFQREVEAVAQLSHPGIVPVYTVGEAAGVPYYAMELIEGASLADVLARLHASNPARLTGAELRAAVAAICTKHGFHVSDAGAGEPLFADSWADSCVWLAREVAQALEHAHQRGVLHRDVKPSNVLLTPAGRVMLVDFGLATTEGAERITRTGAQTGSLAYMAPEQITGDSARVGPRTDVYALGVTLYEAFTLQLPYCESSAPALGQRILAARPERPRRLNPALSADQELVCLAAMEPDTARRYATAADFARDLSNLLARRPIEARAPGAWLSLRRFAQRRPALATALSLGLAGAVVAPFVYGLQEARARNALEAERDAALDAVEFLLERVGHSDLRDVPRVERLRGELLERATQLYARLDATPRPDARTQLRSASALGKLARLRKDTGHVDGAMRDFAAAEARLRALVGERARDPETLFELGNLLAFATVARHPTPSVEAVAAMDDAVAVLRRAVAVDAQARRPRIELARGLCGLAHYQQSTGAPDAARANWSEALELCARLRDQQPADRDALEVWITARARISGLDWSQARHAEGEQGFREVLDATADIADPTSFMRSMRALGAQMLTRALIRREGAERDPEVDRLLAASHAEHEALARDFPQNEVYAANLSSSWLERGDRELDGGDLAMARTCFQEALTITTELAQRTPTAAKHQRSTGLALDRIAAIARTTGDTNEALNAVEGAVMAHAEALRLLERVESREELASARRVLLELHVDRGAAREAAEAARAFADTEPETFSREFDIAQGLIRAAEVAMRSGDLDFAAEARRDTLGHLERALMLDASEAERIVRAIDEWDLAGDADFAALRARASGDG